MSEWFDVWITRYALTTGIFKIRGRLYDDGKSIIGDPDGKHYGYFRAIDWHVDLESAMARAEEMRERRIESLTHQIKQLKEMDILIDES